jgi:hypothetical protein
MSSYSTGPETVEVTYSQQCVAQKLLEAVVMLLVSLGAECEF